MVYKLVITEKAEELLDERVAYLLFKLKNRQARGHLLDEVSKIYERLAERPYQFSDCRDPYLKKLGYKEAIITDMNYIVIFRVEANRVYVVGVFHSLENYKTKI